jgi:hypothetical protein
LPDGSANLPVIALVRSLIASVSWASLLPKANTLVVFSPTQSSNF